MRSISLILLVVLITTLAGCGTGGSDGVAGTGTTKSATIVVQQVTLSGTVPLSSGVPRVVVGTTDAVITGTSWTATVPYATSVNIRYLVDGTQIAAETMEIVK